MRVKKTVNDPTHVVLTIIPSAEELSQIEKQVLEHMNEHVKVPGFRPGKAPHNLIAKYANQEQLQTEFLDSAMSQLYVQAVESEKLRPVDQPRVTVKKFVPFSDLEFDAEIEVVGEIKLGDYQKMRIPKAEAKVSTKEIDNVLETLKERAAEKKAVKRPAKLKDELIIDFKGTDTKTKEPVKGADGKDFPLLLGSNAFIPGFEDALVGMSPAETKEFTLTFPKNYSVKALQNRKVTFEVTIKTINELALPAVDQKFIESVGPFKTIEELKADIKKQLLAENQQQLDRSYENELITKITDASEVAVPAKLVDEQLDRAEREERQNLAYRGQTWEEHLKDEDVTEEQHRERNRPAAAQSVKASLVLSQIAESENIMVTPEELEIRLQLLKGQYQDQRMLVELDKPENRQTIFNQILTEKTFEKLVSYATKTT